MHSIIVEEVKGYRLVPISTRSAKSPIAWGFFFRTPPTGPGKGRTRNFFIKGTTITPESSFYTKIKCLAPLLRVKFCSTKILSTCHKPRPPTSPHAKIKMHGIGLGFRLPPLIGSQAFQKSGRGSPRWGTFFFFWKNPNHEGFANKLIFAYFYCAKRLGEVRFKQGLIHVRKNSIDCSVVFATQNGEALHGQDFSAHSAKPFYVFITVFFFNKNVSIISKKVVKISWFLRSTNSCSSFLPKFFRTKYIYLYIFFKIVLYSIKINFKRIKNYDLQFLSLLGENSNF